jgi:hypothetical protein
LARNREDQIRLGLVILRPGRIRDAESGQKPGWRGVQFDPVRT